VVWSTQVKCRNGRDVRQAKGADRPGPKGTGPGAGAQRSPAADGAPPAERHDLTRSGAEAERGKPVAPPARDSEPRGEPTGRRAEDGGASERRPVTGRIGVEPPGDMTPRRKPADFPRALAHGEPWSTALGSKADLSAGRNGLSGCGPHESGGQSSGRLGVGPKGVPCRDGSAVPRAARSRRAPAALSVGGATAARVRCPGLEPDEGKLSRPVVRPGKAGVFRRSQSCRGNNRKPRSWEGRQEGNRMS
jgi:hypothetical protein